MTVELDLADAADERTDVETVRGIFAAVYAELKRVARRQLAGSGALTLDTTGLVHEAYLKLVSPQGLALRDSGHFFLVAGRAMRQILVDHARRRIAIKRGAGEPRVVFEDDLVTDDMTPDVLIRLDRALDRLGELDTRLVQLVEMRYFAGLSIDEIADTQKLTTRTVHRDWRRARAFLYDAIHAD
jgi:RNA polymerase sigma factor (TIGR02999 family)